MMMESMVLLPADAGCGGEWVRRVSRYLIMIVIASSASLLVQFLSLPSFVACFPLLPLFPLFPYRAAGSLALVPG